MTDIDHRARIEDPADAAHARLREAERLRRRSQAEQAWADIAAAVEGWQWTGDDTLCVSCGHRYEDHNVYPITPAPAWCIACGCPEWKSDDGE